MVPELSIVLVNYKTPQLLLACIKSIITYTTNVTLEIIVVDNCSGDNSEQLVLAGFPQVVWSNMSYNSGFARGNNQGIKMARGKYVLMLNSDTLLTGNSLLTCLLKYRELEQQTALGLLGCKIASPQGHTLPSVHNFFPGFKEVLRANPFVIALLREKARPKPYSSQWYNTSHFASHISGAFMLFNRQRIINAGLLDEDFFLYYEDVEWCYRLQQNNLQHYYLADAVIMHEDGGSHSNNETKKLQILLSQLLYTYKTKGAWAFRCYCFLLKLNWQLDSYLFNRNRQKADNKQAAIQNYRQKALELINRYKPVILQQYKPQPGSAPNFLKYEGAN